MKNKKVKRFIILLLIILWAFLIFGFSSQNGDESSGLSRKIVELFTKNEETIQLVEPYVRKLAHFSEYGLGGILFVALFTTYEWTDKKIIITSILLGIWYAVTDEVHQLMVPNRHGSLFDIYLDSLGFSTGVFFAMMIIEIKRTLKNKKVNEGLK